MKRIAFMGRLTLRKILISLMGAVAFLFGSCPIEIGSGWGEYGPGPEYGTPMPSENLSGTVIGNEKPVPGIYVSVYSNEESGGSSKDYAHTNDYGVYYLYPYGSDSYTVRFVDVDGPLNGEFHTKVVEWKPGDGLLHVVLEPKETTDGQPE